MPIRRTIALTFLVGLLFCVGACSDDDDPVRPASLGTDSSLLEGMWDLTGIRSESSHGSFNVPASEIADDPLAYSFVSGGSGIAFYKDDVSPFTWTVSGSTMSVDGGGRTQSYEFGVSNTTLRLEFDVHDDVVYHIAQTFSRR